MEHLVQRAVTTIRERYGEPLSLDDLARSAMVSKYHFLRTFTKVTGVTPGRFLGAVRLHEAKRLLMTTTLNVADVAVQVGYSSTGSFTRRFTESVGLSPTQYRKLALGARDDTRPPAPSEAPRSEPAADAHRTNSVSGVLRTVGTGLSPAYVGAFATPIMQGAPASWSNVSAPGRFTLAGVPTGTWYIHAVAHGRPPGAAPDAEHTLLVATAGPVRVESGRGKRLDITLSPLDWSQPPILSALMDIDPQSLAA
ncbi:helix-turn-helix domain-containing protein [Streptomyces fructofermentans]|uniref:AraC family transcriptional regulator n=1 Tax=Streptomyces fructofermentans TaxID=152141 RepID=A0A918NSZ5_9ACTN|nr:AraC family transcriptional regulator [Streptomyces fructofermentans]GGX93664.1 AraC family transcriptional regulator [Streptomyces fructofermentans]